MSEGATFCWNPCAEPTGGDKNGMLLEMEFLLAVVEIEVDPPLSKEVPPHNRFFSVFVVVPPVGALAVDVADEIDAA